MAYAFHRAPPDDTLHPLESREKRVDRQVVGVVGVVSSRCSRCSQQSVHGTANIGCCIVVDEDEDEDVYPHVTEIS